MADTGFLTARPIAHRGLHDGNSARWENTASAFDAAIARDFSIELDVQLSADGVAMVFHDDRLERLTDREGPVAAWTAAALGALPVGGTADTIPTLAETLARIGGRVPVVIEMKDNGARNSELARAVADDLADYGGPCAVMSFEHDLIAAFAAAGSPVPVGLTAMGTGEAALASHESAFDLGIAFVSYHVAALPNRFVETVRSRAMPVITWTVRTPEDVALTRAHADQMTFEGFDPDAP